MKWICLAAFFLAPGLAMPGDTDLVQRQIRATGWVRAGNAGIGTGWIVDEKKRLLVTNLHVVGDRKRVEVFFPVFRDGKLIGERAWYLGEQTKLKESGQVVEGRVLRTNEETDLALIELDHLPKGVSSLPLSTLPAEPGDDVFHIGHRHDSEMLWNLTQGVVRKSGKLTDGYFWQGKKLAENAPVMILQLPIHAGDSGGALTNSRGEVVGVVGAIRWQANGSSVAVQVSEVRKMLGEEQPKEKTTPPDDAQAHARALALGTVWIRPGATNQRSAGVIISKERKQILTTASAIGNAEIVDVLFATVADKEPVAEEAAYRDRLGHRLEKQLVQGVVLARDARRDLALIEVDSMPTNLNELAMSKSLPDMGERVHTINHPMGVEMLWLFGRGSVRQIGRVDLKTPEDGKDTRVECLLLQLPQQGGSSGGGIVNDAGALVGLQVSKEAAQQQLAYAISLREIREFLDENKTIADPVKLDDYLRRGRLFSRFGRFEKASIAFQAAVAKGATADCRIEQSFCEMHTGNRYVAQNLVDKVLAEQPQHLGALIQRTHLHLAAKDWKKAIESATAAITGDKKAAPAYALRGEAYRQLQKFDEAMKDFDEAFWHEPNQADAYWFRGQLFQQKKEVDKAILDYTRAVEIEPLNVEPLRNRAQLYAAKKEWKKAISDCERLLETQPLDPDGYNLLGRYQASLGDEAKAIASWGSALRIKWEYPDRIVGSAARHWSDLIESGKDEKTQVEFLRRFFLEWHKSEVDPFWRPMVVKGLYDAQKETDPKMQLKKLNAFMTFYRLAWEAKRHE